MAVQLLKCSANFTAGFDQLLNEGNFVDCSLAAEGQTLRAHRAVLSAASSYFEMLFAEEERDPFIIFTSIRFNVLEAVLRLIYRGEVKVSEDRLAEFLNVLMFLQIDGVDCNESVVRKTNVTTCENTNSFITFEAIPTQESSSVCEKVGGEFSVEESTDKYHILQQYLQARDERSPTKLASENGEPAFGYELSSLISDIDIKDEEINSNLKIEKDDTTTGIEDEPTSKEKNDDNVGKVSPRQDDAKLQFEDVVRSTSAVPNIGNGEELFKCPSCDFETSQQTDLTVHMCPITVESPFESSHCSSSSRQSSVAKKHEFKRPKGKSFKCSQCAYICRNKNNLKSHKLTHAEEKPFRCSQCTYACIRKDNLMYHIRSHTGEKPFKCSQCTYVCSRKHILINHMLNHSGKKPFKCSQCSFACRLKVGLVRHMFTHTKEKPFKCSQCTYACSRKNSLIYHMQNHTGEKPFICSQCTYACSRKHDLINHIRSHTGEKPFKCSQCTYASSRKHNLIRHTNTHEGE